MLFLSLKICFVTSNSVDPGEMPFCPLFEKNAYLGIQEPVQDDEIKYVFILLFFVCLCCQTCCKRLV